MPWNIFPLPGPLSLVIQKSYWPRSVVDFQFLLQSSGSPPSPIIHYIPLTTVSSFRWSYFQASVTSLPFNFVTCKYGQVTKWQLLFKSFLIQSLDPLHCWASQGNLVNHKLELLVHQVDNFRYNHSYQPFLIHPPGNLVLRISFPSDIWAIVGQCYHWTTPPGSPFIPFLRLTRFWQICQQSYHLPTPG